MTRECKRKPSPLEELQRRDNHSMSTDMHTVLLSAVHSFHSFAPRAGKMQLDADELSRVLIQESRTLLGNIGRMKERILQQEQIRHTQEDAFFMRNPPGCEWRGDNLPVLAHSVMAAIDAITWSLRALGSIEGHYLVQHYTRTDNSLSLEDMNRIMSSHLEFSKGLESGTQLTLPDALILCSCLSACNRSMKWGFLRDRKTSKYLRQTYRGTSSFQRIADCYGPAILSEWCGEIRQFDGLLLQNRAMGTLERYDDVATGDQLYQLMELCTHPSVKVRRVLAELPGAVPLDWLLTTVKGELDNA